MANLTKKNIQTAKKLLKVHLKEDPSPTYCEIILNCIAQDNLFLYEIFKANKIKIT